MEKQFNVGDKVRFIGEIDDAVVTPGKSYKIIMLDGIGFRIIDDVDDDVYIGNYEFKYVEKVLDTSAPYFEGYVNIRQVSNLDNGNLLITIECDETVNMALIKAERDVFAKKQERKAEIQTEIARLQRELEELQ